MTSQRGSATRQKKMRHSTTYTAYECEKYPHERIDRRRQPSTSPLGKRSTNGSSGRALHGPKTVSGRSLAPETQMRQHV